MIKISTADLTTRWNDYGMDTYLVVYLDKPHQVQSITQTRSDVVVTTDYDTFVIPRGDKQNLMWRILGY